MFCGVVFAGIGGAVAIGVASASGAAVTMGVASGVGTAGVGVISILGVGVFFAMPVDSVFGFFGDESETLGLQAERENEHIKIIMNARYLFVFFILYYHLQNFFVVLTIFFNLIITVFLKFSLF